MSSSGHFTLSNLEAQNIEVDTISKTILPLNNNVNLGSLQKPFKEIFVSANTLHLGTDVSLGAETDADGNAFFAPNTAMKLKSSGGDNARDIIIDPNEGFTMGDTKIKHSGLEFKGDDGEDVLIDKNLFTNVDERVSRIAKDIGISTSTKSDFGYLIDYKLRIDETTKNVTSIENGNFELGRVFDKTDSLGLNTLVIKEFANKLPTFDAQGNVTLYATSDKKNVRNSRLNENAIKVKFDNNNNLIDNRYIVPIETHTNLRDIFPVDIFDMNKFEGRVKFKADFDSTGSLYYSDDGTTFSGLHALKNYVQVSSPTLYGQNANGVSAAFVLAPYENVVEFISYYQLPLLFENQKTFTTSHTNYEYYSSSLVSNRIDNKVFIREGGSGSASENVYGVNTTISSPQLNLKTNLNKSLYPAIRIIKWKNTYNPTFTRVTSPDMDIAEFKNALGWTSLTDIYTKYTTSTNTGENWISKLVEITYAYLKYGQPVKSLGTVDMTDVTAIISEIARDTSLLEFQNDTTDVAIRIKKTAFQSYM